jgi:hypothetical protein
LAAGIYDIKVTDAKSKDNSRIVITQPSGITASISTLRILCRQCNGFKAVTASGGIRLLLLEYQSDSNFGNSHGIDGRNLYRYDN